MSRLTTTWKVIAGAVALLSMASSGAQAQGLKAEYYAWDPRSAALRREKMFSNLKI